MLEVFARALEVLTGPVAAQLPLPRCASLRFIPCRATNLVGHAVRALASSGTTLAGSSEIVNRDRFLLAVGVAFDMVATAAAASGPNHLGNGLVSGLETNVSAG
jgi:hypothetical protein